MVRTGNITVMTTGKLTNATQIGSRARWLGCRWLGAALWMALALPTTSDAAPRKPVVDTEVLEKLPLRTGDSSAREFADLRKAMNNAATDQALTSAAATLAERYFDLALARGDPRYVGYAEAVLARFSARPLPASLLLIRGLLRQYRHDFEGALSDFAAALVLDPELAEAHAWRAAIHLVQADYAAAHQECAALARLGRKTLYGGCNGLAQAYGGQLEAGYRTLQQALESTRNADQRLWLLTRLGEVAAWRGQSAQAERHFREALQLGRDDGYLLAAWSDFLLDTGRADEVIQQLAGWESSDNLLLRLAEADAILKRPTATRRAQTLEDRFAAAKLRGDTTHRAEEARFRLHLRGDPAQALRLAAENYHVQREPRDARILLEAAIAAGDGAAAEAARAWLQTSGFEDQRLRQLGLNSQRLMPMESRAAAQK